MTYDAVAPLARFADRAGIGFPVLSDQGSKIIGGFNLIDMSQPRSSRWYGIADPMIVLVDADGIVRQRFATLDFRTRPDIDAVLQAIRRRAGG